jgi:hypothetical protein
MSRNKTISTELVGNDLDKKKIVKFRVDVRIIGVLQKPSKTRRGLYVYEFNFHKPYNFMYIEDLCGDQSDELDGPANDYNRQNLRTKQITKDDGTVCNVYYFSNTDTLIVAAHEDSSGRMYISNESTDEPGKDIKEFEGVEDDYQWGFI